MAAGARRVVIGGVAPFLLASAALIRYWIDVSQHAVSAPDRDAWIASLEAQVDARDRVIAMLRAQLARLRRMTFGTSSEKLASEIEQLELALEEYEADAASADARQPDVAARPQRPAPIRSLPPHLPRAEIVHEPATGTCACPSCGGALRQLGADTDEMLDVVPVSWRVVRNIRPKYSCRDCEAIVQAPAPPKPCPRGKATFGTLAHVVVAKFDHHLPLYRQAEMMAAQGVDIDRSTLAGWAAQAAHLLDPIVTRIREEGLKATKIHADDTPVKVLAPGSGKTATGRLWAYVVDDRASGAATPPLVWYRFTPTARAFIPSASSPPLPASSRPTPMPGSTASTRATACPRSHAGRISGASCSSATSNSRPR